MSGNQLPDYIINSIKKMGNYFNTFVQYSHYPLNDDELYSESCEYVKNLFSIVRLENYANDTERVIKNKEIKMLAVENPFTKDSEQMDAYKLEC
jgi:hypothetical protein